MVLSMRCHFYRCCWPICASSEKCEQQPKKWIKWMNWIEQPVKFVWDSIVPKCFPIAPINLFDFFSLWTGWLFVYVSINSFKSNWFITFSISFRIKRLLNQTRKVFFDFFNCMFSFNRRKNPQINEWTTTQQQLRAKKKRTALTATDIDQK